jgi:hypothetical protein
MAAGKGMSKLRDDGRQGLSTGIVNSRQKLPVFATVDLILRICAADTEQRFLTSGSILEPSLLFVEVSDRAVLIHADV